jgi:hypothetical protein
MRGMSQKANPVYFFPGEPIDYEQNPTIVGFSFSSPTSLRWEVLQTDTTSLFCMCIFHRRKYPTSARILFYVGIVGCTVGQICYAYFSKFLF